MTTGAAIRKGFALARRARAAVWVLFLANLGLAALAALPIYRGILRFTGHSLMSEALLRGFPADWFVDFSLNSPGSLERYAGVIALLAILSMPINTVLSGGVLARMSAPESPFSLREFFRDTGRFAWRLIRLMLIGLVGYWIVFRVLNQGLGELVRKWTRDLLDDRPVFLARLAVGLLVILGLVFVNLVMDFARVKLVMEDGSSAAEAFLASLGFAVGRFRKALVVYAIPALGGIALLGLYRLLLPWSAINAPAGGQYREPLTLALLFIVHQAVMFGRYWFRLATWASEWSYYSGSR